MPNSPAANKVTLSIWLDRDLRQAVKAKAARQGKSVTQIIVEYLRKWVAKP